MGGDHGCQSYEMDCEKVAVHFGKPLEWVKAAFNYAECIRKKFALQLKITRKRPQQPHNGCSLSFRYLRCPKGLGRRSGKTLSALFPPDEQISAEVEEDLFQACRYPYL